MLRVQSAVYVLFICHPHSWRVWFMTKYSALFNHNPVHLYVFGASLLQFAVFLLGNAFYVPIYNGWLPINDYKLEKKPWPWNLQTAERATFMAKMRYVFMNITRTQLFFVVPLTYFLAGRIIDCDLSRIPSWCVAGLAPLCASSSSCSRVGGRDRDSIQMRLLCLFLFTGARTRWSCC